MHTLITCFSFFLFISSSISFCVLSVHSTNALSSIASLSLSILWNVIRSGSGVESSGFWSHFSFVEFGWKWPPSLLASPTQHTTHRTCWFYQRDKLSSSAGRKTFNQNIFKSINYRQINDLAQNLRKARDSIYPFIMITSKFAHAQEILKCSGYTVASIRHILLGDCKTDSRSINGRPFTFIRQNRIIMMMCATRPWQGDCWVGSEDSGLQVSHRQSSPPTLAHPLWTRVW